MITSSQLRQKYLDFFISRGHALIPSAPVVPENDPSVMYTTAGMHPLVPYLLGQPHPSGKRLVNVQKCIRTDDIDEVGDPFHHTFFEMLGHWSLGDYYKPDALAFTYELLTRVFGYSPDRLSVTCFAGDADAPRDTESADIWRSLGIPGNRIHFLPKSDNWWGPVGSAGPCGPDSEVFVDTGSPPCNPDCRPGCSCGRYCEVGNDVFMQYEKTTSGKYIQMSRPNVDNGTGLERNLALINGFTDDYLTDLWQPAISFLETGSGLKYRDYQRDFRIIADHLRAAVVIISDGVVPSNKQQGYILRRLIRRAALKLHLLLPRRFQLASGMAGVFIDLLEPVYAGIRVRRELIVGTVTEETSRFARTLEKGLKEFNRLGTLDGKSAFNLFQTYGFPWEISAELAFQKGQRIDRQEFAARFRQHQELSRTASAGMFKGGLQDQSEITTKYHTATHLLHRALREVLGDHVQQKGSNITAERLRFDFSHSDRLSPQELCRVEEIVNRKISENLPVTRREMPKSQALAAGALAFFPEKYPDTVSVYTVGSPDDCYSMELCGGPHVSSTGEIGSIKIFREESAGAGVRRIYARIPSAG